MNTGLVLLSEFLSQIHFDQLLEQYVHIPDTRCLAHHEWLEVLK
ncbi:hypothetical protein WN867_05845 [Tetragenococcus halophilus]